MEASSARTGGEHVSEVHLELTPARTRLLRRAQRWIRTPLAITLALCLAGLVAGAWYGARKAAWHEATAVVLISPLRGNPFSPDGTGSDLVNLETEAQLVRSHRVADDVIAQLELDTTAAELLEGVRVEVPINTQLLRVTAVNRDPDQAVAESQAFAEAFLSFRISRARAASKVSADQVSQQIDELQEELQRNSEQLAEYQANSPDAVLLRQRITDGTTQLGELKAELAALKATRADPGEVVTPAALPESGLLGPRELMAGLGLLAGLALGLGLTALRARRDGRIRSLEDLEDAGVPALGEVTDGGDGDDVATAGVRSGVLASLPQRPLTLALVSAGEEVHVADGLARSMARARNEVVLIDLVGDPIKRREGFSDLILDRVGVDDVLRPVTSHLSKLAPGTDPKRLPDLLSSPDMPEILGELGKRGDVLLLDAGRVQDPACQAIVRHTDGVVLEVEAGRTRLHDIATARAVVWSAGGQIIGLVLVHGADARPVE